MMVFGIEWSVVCTILLLCCDFLQASSVNQGLCKCEKDRAGIFSWIFPWLLVSLISYLFYNYVQNNNDPNSVKSLTGGARINRTVHLLDTSNNSALTKLEQNLPIKSDQFRGMMQLATEFVIEYLGNTEAYSVTNELKPGFLYTKLSSKMPEVAEPFSVILDDIYEVIMPGMTHWRHPRFHGYFPSGCSYPDIVAETIISAFSVVQFSWDSSPVFTELEVAMINWLGRAMGLDESFLFVGNAEQSKGGGAIQPSASDAVLVALMAARNKKMCELVPKSDPNYRQKQAEVLGKLVAYGSAEAHTCSEKACQLAMVRLRPIPSDENFCMRGQALEHEILKDLERGYIPLFIHATSGTTSVCSFDDLVEVTAVGKKYSLWTHVDAAYAGSALICPELRHLMKGINNADSINMNMHKLLLISTPCAVLWTKDQAAIRETYEIEPVYLRKTSQEATDFRNWGISLSRRSKCLKMWFLFRLYGLSNMQEFIRRLVRFAMRFREHLSRDPRINVVGDTFLSLVCFRLKDSDEEKANQMTSDLCKFVNRSHKLLLTHAKPKNVDIIRICFSQERSSEEDVDESWRILKTLIDEFFLIGCTAVSPNYNHFDVDGRIRASPCPTVDATAASCISSLSPVGSLSSCLSPSTSPRTAESKKSAGYNNNNNNKK